MDEDMDFDTPGLAPAFEPQPPQYTLSQNLYDGRKMLDLVFVQDCTGSQGSYISSATKNIKQICAHIFESGKLQVTEDLRIGLVAFRDHPPQDHTYITKNFGFSSDISKVHKDLSGLYASGGGDGPEAVTAALAEALNMDWREHARKMVVLIADAPPHGIGEDGDGFDDGSPDGNDPLQLARAMAGRGITLFSVACEPALSGYAYATDFYQALTNITSGLMLPLTTADMLTDAIVGGVLENLDMEHLVCEVDCAVAQCTLGNNESVDDIAKELHEKLLLRNESTKKVVIESIYKESEEAMHNVGVFMAAASLAEARPLLRQVHGTRFTDKYLQARQTYGTYSLTLPSRPAPKPTPASPKAQADRSVPVPPKSKLPRPVLKKDLYRTQNKAEIRQQTPELCKADGQPTTTNFTYHRISVNSGYSRPDDAACEVLTQKAEAINKMNCGPPSPEKIYRNQENLPQVVANAVGELGGWGWGQYGNVATVFYSIYQDEDGCTRMFQGSAIHAPNHPDAHIEVPKSLAKQHFALLKDQGVPLFTPQHHNPMVPTMHPAEKSSSAALSMPMMVPQTLSHQSRTSAPPTPSHQLRGLAPPTPSPAPRTQQSQHSALKLSPRSQKSFPKPLPKPPQVDGPAPPLARSTKNGNSKHGSSDAEGAPPLKKQRLGAPKAIKSLGSKGIGDKNSKNKMTPHPKTSRVNVQSTTKAQEPGDEPGSDRKHSSRMMNPDYHHSFVAKH